MAGGASAAEQVRPRARLRTDRALQWLPDGPDRLPATMREILSMSLTLRGFINYEFAEEQYPAFLRTVSQDPGSVRNEPT